MTPNDITTDTADHVRELQQYLRIIRRERDGFTDVPIDGRFGEDTAAAVRQFQTEAGLPADGNVDRATWEAARDTAREIIALHALPVAVQAFRMDQKPLEIGDNNASVMILQVMLFALSVRFINLPKADAPDGIYTENTASVVRSLQRHSGLPETGTVNKPTWDAITILYNQTI